MRRGRPPYPDLLTPREQQVLELVREGLTNQQIADRLGISLYGARYHVSEILSKLGVSSREEAAAWEPERGRASRFPALGFVFGWKQVAAAGAFVAVLGAVVVAGILSSGEPSDGLGKVAFIRDGNLWVKTLPDGPVMQLTSEWGASTPRWSPSGEWILYQGSPSLPEDNGLWVVRADGSEERLLQSEVASWSPTADVLALTLPDTTLVVENADGTGRRQVLQPIAGSNSNRDSRSTPVWSSDGRWIIFDEYHADPTRPSEPRWGCTGCGGYSYVGVRAVRADGSNEHEVFSAPISPEGYVALMPAPWWSAYDIGAPAFAWITPTSGNEPADAGGLPLGLMALSVTSSLPDSRAAEATAQLASQEGPGVSMLLFHDFMAVSPDGKTLALVDGVALQDTGGERSAVVDAQTAKAIVLMDLQTGETRPLTGPDIVAVAPAWSPEGERIAFLARPDTGPVGAQGLEGDSIAEQARRIWTMRSDGSDAGPIDIEGVECRHERPQWSSDGEALLFLCLTAEGYASLWQVPARGGTAERVVDEVSLVIASGPLPPFPGRYGNISWQQVYDWWQP
jgi:DNA-binding CsgD family transcriptional regulator/Tol biopolymer transport system component